MDLRRTLIGCLLFDSWDNASLNNEGWEVIPYMSDYDHKDGRKFQSGVPQGFILGSLVFLIFINDIAFLQNNNSADLFADDTSLSKSYSNIAEIQHNLQNRLNLIQKWCDINNVVIHPD